MDNFPSDYIPVEEPVKEPPKKAGGGLWSFLKDVVEILVLSIILFVAINAVTARSRVDGSSMEPTLHNGEFVIVNKLAYKLGKPQTGDIIVFNFPRDLTEEYIKRVIGTPGDTVEISAGRVRVNGNLLREPYIAAAPNYNGSWKVPENNLFVLGDNRNNSSDSHVWGLLPVNEVVGKAVVIYWPPQYWSLITHTP